MTAKWWPTSSAQGLHEIRIAAAADVLMMEWEHERGEAPSGSFAEMFDGSGHVEAMETVAEACNRAGLIGDADDCLAVVRRIDEVLGGEGGGTDDYYCLTPECDL